MKITKPSQLREGMKLKGKYIGIPISGYAAHAKHGTWCIIPQAIAFASDASDEIYYQFADLESVEGIRAAKEGDVLVLDGGDDEYVVGFVNDFIVCLSDGPNDANGIYTYEQLERWGYKLKDQEQPSTDTITLDGKTYKRDDVLERIKELEPID